MYYEFHLKTRPLSKKNKYVVGKSQSSGRRFIYSSDKSKQNENDLISEFGALKSSLGLKTIEDDVEVTIMLKPSRSDIINQAETVLDAMQGGHALKGIGLILKDDKQVSILHITKDLKDDDEYECVVIVKFPPLTF